MNGLDVLLLVVLAGILLYVWPALPGICQTDDELEAEPLPELDETLAEHFADELREHRHGGDR